MNKRRTLFFKAPYEVETREETVPAPGRGEVLVHTELSAISSGTELLFYRNEVPPDLPVDDTIEGMADRFSYPLKYGYALVGRVETLGSGVQAEWLGKRVFVFHPHESAFVSHVDSLHVVPQELPSSAAVLLPLMETAVAFMMDAQPLIGERVVVLGQGIVGLLTTALLARYPLTRLITADRYQLRRKCSRALGADECLDPAEASLADRLGELLSDLDGYQGADLIFELSGNPQALDVALSCAGYDGRVLIGSWYGQKKASLDLGGRFHRSHVRLISSQVSHIAPRWRGRFGHARRLNVAWFQLGQIETDMLISHRFPIEQAAQAYRLLDQQPGSTVQVLLSYD